MTSWKLGHRVSFDLIVLALVVGALLYDLYYPRTAKMRQFDPNEVARLETAMWRSYYDKKQVQLFNQLSELLRTQYHMPLVRSNQVAYYAANAAFAFKGGKTQADYEKALPELVKFYGAIREITTSVRRRRSRVWNCNGGFSSRALETRTEAAARARELHSAIYGVPVEQVLEHGRLRAEHEDPRHESRNGAAMTEEDCQRLPNCCRCHGILWLWR